MQSEKIDVLVKALIKAKSKFAAITRNKVNPYFKSKYADLSAVQEAVEVPLAENGICVVQTTDAQNGKAVLVTTLAHESGQWISGNYPLNPTKDDPQGLGAAVTYARRYALSAILGLVTEDDDDGNAVSHVEKQEKPAERPASNGGGEKRKITDAQGKRLYAIWKSHHIEDQEVKDYIKQKYGFASTRDITADVYDDVIAWVESQGVGA